MIRPAATASSGVAVLVAALLLAVTANASGGSSIATAPELPLGQLVAGGGQQADFWRIQLFAGDRITFKASFPSIYEFSLYAPSVDDFSYANANSVANNPGNAASGMTEFTFTSPFTGLGTLAVCEDVVSESGCGGGSYPKESMDAYTFTATIAHATNLTISVPTIARRRSTVTIRATISSPAGVPQGNCLIQNQLEPLKGGYCSQRLRLGRGRKQTVAVSFVPEDGWLGAEGHRTVRLVA